MQGTDRVWSWRGAGALFATLLALAAAPQAGAQAQPTGAADAAPGRLPVELFFEDPDIREAKLSPSGRWVAMTVVPAGQRVRLLIFDSATGKPVAQAAHFSDADIDDFFWVNDERLVFDLADRLSGGGDQRFWPGLFSVARTGGPLTPLVQNKWFGIRERQVPGREALEVNHSLLHVPRTGGDEVIVGEHRWTGAGEPDGVNAKRLNVVTRRITSLSRGTPENVWNWMFDAAGEPRLVITRSKGRSGVHWREADAWREIADHDFYNMPWRPSFVTTDGKLYVTVASGSSGERQLHRFDFKSGQPEREPVVKVPGFDFLGGIVSETAGGRDLGVRVETDAATTVWFDARLAALQKEADQKLPGRINVLTCRRCDEADMTVLIRSYADQDPGTWVVYTAADKQWRILAQKRPKIDPRRMATLDFERFKARDGRSIPVWITRPVASVAPRDKPLPAVVLVHGGPWVRGGTWGWDGEAQFLASRGYVVIEPEFRGSDGYGQSHFRAGWKQWGQAMQDDVADATLWAAAKGLADPKRICIAGASYGGYATLMGLIRHGELYRCGVSWVAVTDPRLLFKWNAQSDGIEEFRRYSYPQLIGDPVADAAMLDANTPVLRAAEIKRPLLLAMGQEDRRVPIEHGTALRDAMRRNGQTLEWVVYPDEGHGWYKFENRVDFYRRMERFLAEHLK
ncbi:MAG: alpha/beta hydrolase family protein [Rubrivivax sp.]|jgi:dipeptidyl aminopeptidase/acylaminoacyl peptidase|nr:prolyl oligopeptidase family serine peptidase [Rubrivivax sp.]